MVAHQTPHAQAATLDAAINAHREALITDWKQARGDASQAGPPMPGDLEAFLRLVEAGWDAEATRRPHGAHTTVVVHLDLAQRAAALHLGPLLTDAERRYLTCDATCEVWFHPQRPAHRRRAHHAGDQPAAAPRPSSTATDSCAVPGCGPPAACTPTTSGTGKTAGPPNCPTSYWSAPITTGHIIAG